jgi:hypothetical protein
MTFHFVRHHRVLDYMACGWMLTCADIGHHARYSVLMQWPCECQLAVPE